MTTKAFTIDMIQYLETKVLQERDTLYEKELSAVGNALDHRQNVIASTVIDTLTNDVAYLIFRTPHSLEEIEEKFDEIEAYIGSLNDEQLDAQIAADARTTD